MQTDFTLDTSYTNTKQLDYYYEKSVTSAGSSSAIKYYNTKPLVWWTRSIYAQTAENFVITSNGMLSTIQSATAGVAPAFRIGE